MYKLLLVCLAVFLFAFTPGDKKPAVKVSVKKTPLTLRIDSSAVTIRQFDKAALDKYRADPEFKYYVKSQAAQKSWWQRLWEWFWDVILGFFNRRGAPGKTSPLVKYIMLAIVVCMLVYVIVKLLGNDLSNIFGKESKSVDIPYDFATDDIHQITFEEEIERALVQQNYRMAVRFLFLRTLKQLSDAQLIHWQIEKTNTAYLNELKAGEQRQAFGVLTRQFEYVWYGDFPVNEQSFYNIQTLFQDFKQLIR